MRFWNWFCLLFVSCLLQHDLFANEIQAEVHTSVSNKVHTSLISEVKSIEAGQSFWIAVKQIIEPGWHTYWKNAGDVGAPINIYWDLPEGFEASNIQWPYPERIPYGDFTNFGYHDEVILLTEVTPRETIEKAEVEIKARVEWLVCKDVCIPEQANLEIVLPVTSEKDIDERQAPIFAKARLKLPQHAPIKAYLSREREKLQISIALPGLAKNRIKTITYFPFTPNTINNSAAQTFSVNDSEIRLRLLAHEELDNTPSSFEGIIVVGDDVGQGLNTSFVIKPMYSGGIAFDLTLWAAIILAFLGGIILNFMPCVFPVLSIKILSLIETARGGSIKLHALVYFFGVVFSFLGIAIALLFLRAAGEQVGWGFQLQSPIVIGSLAYLFVILGLNLSGLFEIRLSWLGLGDMNASKAGYAASFFTGVLASVVAAPCTAPFMGAALGYAITQSNVVALAVFGSLGAGMATPFCLISFLPGVLKRLPRPGSWMETLRQLLAFPLYASAIWLLWVLGIQTGPTNMLYILSGLLIVIFAIWLSKQFVNLLVRNIIVGSLLLIPVILLGSLHSEPKESAAVGDNSVIPYSEDALQRARNEGAVFVNFTAAWCITCKVNEITVLKTNRVREAFAGKNIKYMEGDWTREDPVITEALERFARTGVPLYLLYPADGGNARILPQILTEGILLRAIDDL